MLLRNDERFNKLNWLYRVEANIFSDIKAECKTIFKIKQYLLRCYFKIITYHLEN